MAQSLKVIALISGGKDSVYSILHCRQNGHQVVALGNLHPLLPAPISNQSHVTSTTDDDEHDLNSFMYQTIGHTVIPLYAEALNIPLYRQPILGSAVQTSSSYAPANTADADADETESLVPLLQTILAAQPGANALCTGAILSTYQRTRIESVALRLGLTPLSYLWQYPILPPGRQISLLEDMNAAGMDARIVKVASGGLDDEFLWTDIASVAGMRRVERAMKRFGADGDGAVLGEGGEFETLVVDGPRHLFKGRIVIGQEGRRVVREGGGAAWLAVDGARVEMKSDGGEDEEEGGGLARIPDLLDERFKKLLETLRNQVLVGDDLGLDDLQIQQSGHPVSIGSKPETSTECDEGTRWTIVARPQSHSITIEHEMEDIVTQMRDLLLDHNIKVNDVVSTVVLLRSMKDFATINKTYATLFSELNPPSRVTIAVGAVLPVQHSIVLHATLSPNSPSSTWSVVRRALHIQSRSYWAPANIGPYSQAQSVPLNVSVSDDGRGVSGVYIAGQIPLVPASMVLPDLTIFGHGNQTDTVDSFKPQAVLALQHLWRIGTEMHVSWWTGGVAYVSRDSMSNIITKARIAGAAWKYLHRGKTEGEEGEDEERDLWEERHHGGLESRGGQGSENSLPEWSIVEILDNMTADNASPFFAAEVEELPRDSAVEWHGILGLTGGPIKIQSQGIPCGSVHTCVVANELVYTTMMIYQQESEVIDLAGLTADIRVTGRVGYYGSYAAYLDVSVEHLWSGGSHSGVIPCRSLWDADGRRLAAVLLFRGVVGN